MKTQIGGPAVNNKDIERIIDNIRVDNSSFIIELYKYLRNIKEEKLKDNIVIYDNAEYKNFGFKDKAIARVVARYKDIMLCIDVYNKYDSKMIVQNMMTFAKIIRKVAADIDLDRVIYVRIFKKGSVNKETGFIKQKGYVDKYREFNVDILDMLTISLEEINNLEKNELADIMKYWH